MKKKMVASQIQSELSIQRTRLANRRTFLAYFRTAVALIVAGAGLMKFIQNDWWFAIGVICVALTPVVLIFGVVDFILTQNLIKKETEYFNKNYMNESSASERINESETLEYTNASE